MGGYFGKLARSQANGSVLKNCENISHYSGLFGLAFILNIFKKEINHMHKEKKHDIEKTTYMNSSEQYKRA